MADDNDLTVKFGASTEDVEAGAKRVSDAVGGVSASVDGLGEKLNHLAEAFGVAFSIEGLKSYIGSMAELGLNTERTGAMLGVSNEQVVALSGFAKLGGESVDQLATEIERMSLQAQRSTRDGLNPQAQAFKVLGINVRDLIGQPADQWVQRFADAVSKFNPSLNLTNAVMQAGGRGIAQMLPTLLQGKEHTEEFLQAWQRASEGIASGAAGMDATDEKLSLLDQSMTSFGARIFTAVKPAIDAVVTAITNWLQSFHQDEIRDFANEIGTSTINIAQSVALFFVDAEEVFQKFVSVLQSGAPVVHAAAAAALFSVGQIGLALDQLQAAGEDAGKATPFAQIEIDADKARAKVNDLAQASRDFVNANIPKSGSGAAMAADLLSISQSAQQAMLAATRQNADAINEQAAQMVAAAQKAIDGQIKVLQTGLKEKTTLYTEEANTFQITQNQKYKLLEDATEQEYAAELALLEKEKQIGNLTVAQRQEVDNKIKALEAKHTTDMINLDREAIQAQQQMWSSALGSIESSFNSQLRGLLAGTTTWSQAWKTMLGDMIIKFIEMCETMVVKWTAAQLAQTTAATTGAAARAAAENTASTAGFLSMAANAVRAIMTDAAQAFAGVFAFLAPVMGPAAAGPAAAAQASVSAAAIFDVGTDYVVRGGLALIHPGETIIPAAKGSGPFTGAGMGGAQIHAPVSISVSALDSRSVKRFFDDNSHHMMRAINDAVKRGAHLGLRTARA